MSWGILDQLFSGEIFFVCDSAFKLNVVFIYVGIPETKVKWGCEYDLVGGTLDEGSFGLEFEGVAVA